MQFLATAGNVFLRLKMVRPPLSIILKAFVVLGFPHGNQKNAA